MGFSVTPLINVDYSVQDQYGTTITVAGLPVKLYDDGNGFLITAVFQTVYISGSPVVAYFNPPITTVDDVNIPALVIFLATALLNGAVIG